MSIQALIDATNVKNKLNGSSVRLLSQLRRELTIQTGKLANYIKSAKLSGQVLKNRTGNLRNSIVPKVGESGAVLTGTVFVDSTAPYGRYQEYGAHIPERIPVKAKALRWYAGGSPVFAMRARAFTLPPRPFMGPSLDEKQAEITSALRDAINTAVKE